MALDTPAGNALLLSALHAHAHGSQDPCDEILRPLPITRHSSARNSFVGWLPLNERPPVPKSPLEAVAQLYPPPPHLTPSGSPVPSPRALSPSRSSHSYSRKSTTRTRSRDRPRSAMPDILQSPDPSRQPGAQAGAAEQGGAPPRGREADSSPWLDDDHHDPMHSETEVVGLLKVEVVEAKDLALAPDTLAKPYVLLQYDRTDSVSREWGAPPAGSAADKDGQPKKIGVRRLRQPSASGGTTTRRVVGGPNTTSTSSSAAPSPVTSAFGSSPSSSSRPSTSISSLPSTTLSSDPPKYRPEQTLRPVSPTPPSLPPEVIGIASSPIWNHHATFDVVAPGRTLLLCVYDKLAPQGGPPTRAHGFLGACVFEPPLLEGEEATGEDGKGLDVWVPLTSALDETIKGEIRLRILFEPLSSRPKLTIADFQLLRLIGQGSFGQVFRVRKRDTKRIYALKVIRKATVGDDSRAMRQVWTERKVLEGNNDSPFLCGLKFGFQNESCFFFCLDYKAGGEMFQHLQRDGGRFEEAKVRFYVAEIVLALGFLHERGVVYRDLKPENCLLDGSGHVVLCDFGLSKILENEPGERTWTLCGTTSFLAPEVLLDVGYSYPADWWSLGVLLFEMCWGYSPFFHENRLEEYERILTAEIRIPGKKGYSEEVKDLVRKLLERDVPSRLGSAPSPAGVLSIQSHPFFSAPSSDPSQAIDWPRLALRQCSPPYKPPTHADDDQPDWNDDGRMWRFDLDVGVHTGGGHCGGGGGGGGGGGEGARRSSAASGGEGAARAQCSLVRGFTYRHREDPAGKWWDRKAAALWGRKKVREEGEGGEAEEEAVGSASEGEGERDAEERGRTGGGGPKMAVVERFKQGEMECGTRRSSCA